MTRAEKKEFTLRISQANKTQMIVILYEMFLVYVKDGIEAHQKENRQNFRESIRKARGCLTELINSLNLENDLSIPLLQLYLYANKELARADVCNKTEPLENINIVINGLHEAYIKVVFHDTSKPVMENTQAVYAGLTYGKNDLQENLYDQGRDRGFLA